MRMLKGEPYLFPLHRVISLYDVITPVAIDRLTYPNGVTMSFLYIFGIRVARWNTSK